ncbi:hypothetical protein HHL16_06855 [Pseudoflavitalea sp. G-6-1-2]|uniref:hypothetical protein n=1 Tax=Pseudoflavitalea sp. G-6-1-2 TaxID=2728841 RepID=UPI00146A9A38|nr:hypothetical protein [Pseudoflavitalea sp. G-6-1-2]NML20585.1 hypothetical protein [Pseudoflavitalea sp. G-6-1-2]
MSQTDQSLSRFNEKLQLVVQQYQAMQRDNARMQKELQELKGKDELHVAQIAELENKVAALKMAAGQIEVTDRKELEKKLNLYIREIDRCIAMLGD